ncbi:MULTISPECIES: alpha/beta fold hydrolase [Solirubrobacterales]|nr:MULTISPECIES: alpha/beta hydrolase [Solirubrobacterales]
MSSFVHDGHRLAYTEHGPADGPPVVLVHGLLFSQKLMTPVAQELAHRGYRAITLDLLGHGRSDRPPAMQEYSMAAFGRQIVGLLDHLGIERAVLHGLSLGANSALEAAVIAPDRVQGLVIEMPVLDNALMGCAIGFTPIMLTLSFARAPMQALAAVTRRIPTGGLYFADLLLDVVRQDPGPSNAVFHGLFFHRVAPTQAQRRAITAPTLVVGHPNDPIHPFSDADALVHEIAGARMVRMRSIVEGRVLPGRLVREILGFLEETFATEASRSGRTRRNGHGPVNGTVRTLPRRAREDR